MNKRSKIVELLINAGGQEFVLKHGGDALCQAAGNGYKDIVTLLIDKGGQELVLDHGGDALYQAAGNGHKDIVTLLIEKGGQGLVLDHGGDALLAANIYDFKYIFGCITTPIIGNHLKGEAKLNAEKHTTQGIGEVLVAILKSNDQLTIKTALPILEQIYNTIPSSAPAQGEGKWTGRNAASDPHPLCKTENGTIEFAENWKERMAESIKNAVDTYRSFQK